MKSGASLAIDSFAAEMRCSLEAQCYRTSTELSVQSFTDRKWRSAGGEVWSDPYLFRRNYTVTQVCLGDAGNLVEV